MNNNNLQADQSGFLPLADTAKELNSTEDEVLRRAVLDGLPLVVPYADEIMEWNGNATGRTFSVHCFLSDWVIRRLMAKGEVSVPTDALLGFTPAPNKKFRNLADALLCYVPDSPGSGHYDLTTKTQELLIRKRDVGAMASHLLQFKSFFTPDPVPSKFEADSFSHCVTQPSLPPPPPLRTVDTSRAPDLKIKRNFEKPDWEKWTACDVVALWQAACLAAEIEPPNRKTGPQVWNVEILAEFQLESFPSDFQRIWAIVNADEILRKIEVDPVAGRMFGPVHLPGFAKRMIEKGVLVPPEMRDIAARYRDDISELVPQEPLAEGSATLSKTDARAGKEVTPNGSQSARTKTLHRATEEELIDAFSCRKDLFRDGHKFDWFKEARQKGSGGKNAVKPTFDPYLFAVNLPGTSYGGRLTPNLAWSILERKFPDRYLEVESYDPRRN